MKKLTFVLVLTLSPALAGEADRLQRALDWPKVDLETYETVYIEDIQVTDPMGPARMANFVAFSLDPDIFPKVERRQGDRRLALPGKR